MPDGEYRIRIAVEQSGDGAKKTRSDLAGIGEEAEDLRGRVKQLEDALEALGGALPDDSVLVNVDADTTEAQAALGSLAAEPVTIATAADTSEARAELDGLKTDPVTLKADADISGAQGKLKQLQDTIDDVDPIADITSEVSARINTMRERVESLKKSVRETRGFSEFEDEAEESVATIALLEQELGEVNEQLRKTAIGSEAFDNLKAKAAGLDGQLKKVKGSQDGIAGSGSLAALGKLAAGVFTVQKAWQAATTAINEAAKAEEAALRLRKAAGNVGIIDTAGFSSEIRKLGEELEAELGVIDSQIEATAQRLTLFGADPSQLRSYIDTVGQLAAVMEGDFDRASLAFAKALQGNFDSLREAGFVFEEGASKAQKLESAMRQAAERGADVLAASAGGLNSEWDRVKDNFGDVLGRLGAVSSEAVGLSSILTAVADGLSAVSGKASGARADLQGFEKVSVDLDAGAKSAEALALGLEKTGESAGRSKDALSTKLQALAETKQAEDDLAAAILNRALAEVDASDRTPESKAAARAALNQKAGNDQAKRELELLNAQRAEREAAIKENADLIAQAEAVAAIQIEREKQANFLDAARRDALRAKQQVDREILPPDKRKIAEDYLPTLQDAISEESTNEPNSLRLKLLEEEEAELRKRLEEQAKLITQSKLLGQALKDIEKNRQALSVGNAVTEGAASKAIGEDSRKIVEQAQAAIDKLTPEVERLEKRIQTATKIQELERETRQIEGRRDVTQAEKASFLEQASKAGSVEELTKVRERFISSAADRQELSGGDVVGVGGGDLAASIGPIFDEIATKLQEQAQRDANKAAADVEKLSERLIELLEFKAGPDASARVQGNISKLEQAFSNLQSGGVNPGELDVVSRMLESIAGSLIARDQRVRGEVSRLQTSVARIQQQLSKNRPNSG